MELVWEMVALEDLVEGDEVRKLEKTNRLRQLWMGRRLAQVFLYSSLALLLLIGLVGIAGGDDSHPLHEQLVLALERDTMTGGWMIPEDLVLPQWRKIA